MQTCFESIRRRLASPEEGVLGVGYNRWCGFSLALVENTFFKNGVTKKNDETTNGYL